MTQVLLLNSSYVPLNVITPKRALALLTKGKAVAVDGVATVLRSSTKEFAIPSVLKLKYYVRVPDRQAAWSKWGVMRRDNYTCVYCGYHSLNRTKFTVDHIIPKARGGKNSWSNTACACFPCNQRKGSRTLKEANMRLQFVPKIPRTSYLTLSGQIPTEWKIYIKTT